MKYDEAPEMLIIPDRKQLEALYGNIEVRRERIADLTLRGAVLTPFCSYWRNEESTFLYHTIRQESARGDLRLFEILEHLSKPAGERSMLELSTPAISLLCEMLPWLAEHQFLIPPGRDPSVHLAALRKSSYFAETSIRTLYLFLTHECNLRCAYCYKDSHITAGQMSDVMARKGLSLFEEIMEGSHPVIIFYGGEPMLNWDVISSLIREIRGKKSFQWSGATIELFTNATLIAKDQAKALRDFGVLPVVSIDGLSRHHDAFRLTKSGKGTWKETLRGYDLMKESGLEPAVSCVLGGHNIRDLREILVFFHERLGAESVRFRPITGLSPDAPSALRGEELLNELIQVLPLLRERGIEDNIFCELMALMKAGRCRFRSCGAYGGQIVVMPDGSVGPCVNLTEKYSHLWGKLRSPGISQKIRKSPLTTRWLRRSPPFLERCVKCIGLGVCGGGCGEQALVTRGAIEENDQRQCGMMPGLIKLVVERTAK